MTLARHFGDDREVTAPSTRGRTALLYALMAAISFGLALAASEIVLRVIYRDAGRTTLAGPGGREFVYTYVPGGELRGPMATGPKAAGVQRIMVLGDSITWGQGVTAWTDTYPAKLLETLNTGGARYDMAVFAYPGKEIDNHLAAIAKSAAEVNPDLVLYQWYNNDIEMSKAGRPASRRAWRNWSGHATLKSWSYLYYILDFALDSYLPQSGRSYLQYLQEDFADGTPGWQAFTRTFHNWAAYATGYAPRTILMLYPPVPATALGDLRQRMTALAAGQVLRYFPTEMTHAVGAVAADGSAISTPAGAAAGELAATPPLRLAHGDYRATLQLRLDAPAAGAAAHITVTQGADDAVLASIDVPAAEFGAPGAWHATPVTFRAPAPLGTNLVLHVAAGGGVALSVGALELPVHYGIEVVDLTPHFADLNTAASLFDAHPNARAHAVMADVLARTIQAAPAAAGR